MMYSCVLSTMISDYHGMGPVVSCLCDGCSRLVGCQDVQGDARAQHRPVFVCEGSEAQGLTVSDLEPI